MKTIYIATDHAGFELKNALSVFLRDELTCEVVDCGAKIFDAEDDYPGFMKAAALAVSEAPHERVAILIGGSGTGEAIVGNRFPGVRTVTYYGGNTAILTLSREHNDANALSLGARFLSETEAKEAVALWLKTPFSGEDRHVRRIAQIDESTH